VARCFREPRAGADPPLSRRRRERWDKTRDAMRTPTPHMRRAGDGIVDTCAQGSTSYGGASMQVQQLRHDLVHRSGSEVAAFRALERRLGRTSICAGCAHRARHTERTERIGKPQLRARPISEDGPLCVTRGYCGRVDLGSCRAYRTHAVRGAEGEAVVEPLAQGASRLQVEPLSGQLNEQRACAACPPC
jgi:hypothetical protein